MIGIVLAAGVGRRLRPVTDNLPKALIPVAGATTILDFTLRNMATVGITDVVVVVGYAGHAIARRRDELEDQYGVQLELIYNDRAEEWNNSYSLWCARDHLSAGFLLANGDTLHPASVSERALAHATEGIVLCLDDVRPLSDEQMKVKLDPTGAITHITKEMPPAEAAGEYMGVTRACGDFSDSITKALEDTWRRDPSLYYEDAYQVLVDRGYRLDVVSVGDLPWVEVDDHADLDRAREVACLLS